MPYNTIRKIPAQEWIIEKEHLLPWVSICILPAYIMRNVRLDNTFSYLRNFYSLPQGTFKKDAQVMLGLKGDELHIHDEQRIFLCKHPVAHFVKNCDRAKRLYGSL